MPTYEYECQDCGIHFERRQKITEEALKTCPECKGEVRRVIYPVGIVFKGSGWYVTDHRRPQPMGDSEPSSKKSETAEKKEPEAKTTEKPAATSSSVDE
jgi:putative FmdB family regulatory protein